MSAWRQQLPLTMPCRNTETTTALKHKNDTKIKQNHQTLMRQIAVVICPDSILGGCSIIPATRTLCWSSGMAQQVLASRHCHCLMSPGPSGCPCAAEPRGQMGMRSFWAARNAGHGVREQHAGLGQDRPRGSLVSHTVGFGVM